MSNFVEFVSYKAPDVPEGELMALRNRAIVAVREAHPSLVAVPAIMRTGPESYTDVWIYQSAGDAEEANAGAGAIAPFMEFMSKLTDIEFQTGDMPEGAENPLP